jgi:hypothetical protein
MLEGEAPWAAAGSGARPGLTETKSGVLSGRFCRRFIQ